MIAVVDYGLGNLRSVLGALEKLGVEAVLAATPDMVLGARKLILPGVGAFGQGMANLKARGLDTAIKTRVVEGNVPILGICLGMQLLASGSSEFGAHSGLDLIPGNVVRLTSDHTGQRIPHVGWNTVHQMRSCPLFQGVPDESFFYHVHSFHFLPQAANAIVAESRHGHTFCTAVAQGNVFGVQFHPEKSQRQGLSILQNFLDI